MAFRMHATESNASDSVTVIANASSYDVSVCHWCEAIFMPHQSRMSFLYIGCITMSEIEIFSHISIVLYQSLGIIVWNVGQWFRFPAP